MKEDLPNLLAEDAIPGFSLMEPIGAGSQGVVYMATELAHCRIVAIKILIEGRWASKNQVERFNREIGLLAQLDHPHIVPVYASGTAEGRPYFVTKYIAGVGLDEYVVTFGPTTADIVAIMITMSDAINAAHQKGIMHRDIKPSNLLVDLDGNPYVLDFGLAKHVESGDTMTAVGHVCGTRAFMAPEQRACEEIDTRCDIYALGAVLQLILLGRSLDKDLQAVIRKAMADVPDERYQSASELREDLQRWSNGDAVMARYHQTFYILRKTLRRVRVPLAASVAIAAVGVGAWLGIADARERTGRIANQYRILMNQASLSNIGAETRDTGSWELVETDLNGRESLYVEFVAFDTFDRLAETFYQHGYNVRAGEAVAQALTTMSRLEELAPESTDVVLRRAFAHILVGRRAYAQSDWITALAEYEAAARIRRELNRPHELALALERSGSAARKLKRYDDAIAYFIEARTIHGSAGSSPAIALDLARVDIFLANAYLDQRKPDLWQRGSDLLAQVERRLDQLGDNGSSSIAVQLERRRADLARTQRWMIDYPL